ncbi:hypothetical protein FVR03_02165 [Pontibacter qinzhouensis]|uniref:YcxB family protein n=1 Tax=Pontibacter qinzhouensis TaxID=2603253 RepID=A0A5C8KEZ2_9BACT|nr:hypothetical protein [Pontibacter qinzhouensis]TXK52090.1 hypothetical protein FVR03_02165 [Pontibacter qinzhouensis]
MSNFSLKLFENAYQLEPKAEQRLTGAIYAAISINLILLLYLAYSNGFLVGLLIFMSNLFFAAYFCKFLWYQYRPQYRLHFTLTTGGVRYRTVSAQKEQEFEWEEVDVVRFEQDRLLFVLKNDEQHEIGMDKIQSPTILQQARRKIKKIAKKKDIMVVV